jgi:succinate-acetate transporter protein
MLSMINAGLFNIGTLPAVFGVGFIVGGLTQLIAGLIQLRTGNTFDGVLFSTFGAFWMALYFDLQFYLKEATVAQAGHALALLLFAFGIFAALMFLASFRTSIVVCVALVDLTATLFVLGAGKYSADAGLVKAGGWMGLLLAALAFYLALAAVCQASYGREVLPVGHLAKKLGAGRLGSVAQDGSTMMTSSVRGPCTPSTRSNSMSTVADGPLIQVCGRSGRNRVIASGRRATTWLARTMHRR